MHAYSDPVQNTAASAHVLSHPAALSRLPMREPFDDRYGLALRCSCLSLICRAVCVAGRWSLRQCAWPPTLHQGTSRCEYRRLMRASDGSTWVLMTPSPAGAHPILRVQLQRVHMPHMHPHHAAVSDAYEHAPRTPLISQCLPLACEGSRFGRSDARPARAPRGRATRGNVRQRSFGSDCAYQRPAAGLGVPRRPLRRMLRSSVLFRHYAV